MGNKLLVCLRLRKGETEEERTEREDKEDERRLDHAQETINQVHSWIADSQTKIEQQKNHRRYLQNSISERKKQCIQELRDSPHDRNSILEDATRDIFRIEAEITNVKLKITKHENTATGDRFYLDNLESGMQEVVRSRQKKRAMINMQKAEFTELRFEMIQERQETFEEAEVALRDLVDSAHSREANAVDETHDQEQIKKSIRESLEEEECRETEVALQSMPKGAGGGGGLTGRILAKQEYVQLAYSDLA